LKKGFHRIGTRLSPLSPLPPGAPASRERMKRVRTDGAAVTCPFFFFLLPERAAASSAEKGFLPPFPLFLFIASAIENKLRQFSLSLPSPLFSKCPVARQKLTQRGVMRKPGEHPLPYPLFPPPPFPFSYRQAASETLNEPEQPLWISPPSPFFLPFASLTRRSGSHDPMRFFVFSFFAFDPGATRRILGEEALYKQ